MKSKYKITCKEAARLLSDNLEYRLPLSKRIYLRLHLAMCKGCKVYGEQIRGLKKLLVDRGVKHKDQPLVEESKLSDQAVDRMKKALDDFQNPT